jgi:GDP-mannose 6-dehydrogenase
MKIAIFGTGYVGCVSAACLAKAGHDVTGVDLDPAKVRTLNAGKCPVVEPGVDELIEQGLAANRLRAQTELRLLGDASIICVGTPSRENGSIDLTQVCNVIEQIGRLLASHDPFHVVIIRSTVTPGTTEETLLPLLEKHSGKKEGRDFAVGMNPEFLRETTAVKDYFDPPFTIIGCRDPRVTDAIREIYNGLSAPLISTGVRVAEMVKYACNAFHATKITFANEIGNVCKSLNIDSHEVMRLVCADRKLNLSPYYLLPGFAFGGSCLPKDMRALLRCARDSEVELPMLGNVLASNSRQIRNALELIRRTDKKRIGLLGLSFKAGTDDLRESPLVRLAEELVGKGYELAIYDSDVALPRLTGTNRRFVDVVLPHLGALLEPDIRKLCQQADVLVIGKKNAEIQEALLPVLGHKPVVDLVRIDQSLLAGKDHYHGLCW